MDQLLLCGSKLEIEMGLEVLKEQADGMQDLRNVSKKIGIRRCY